MAMVFCARNVNIWLSLNGAEKMGAALNLTGIKFGKLLVVRQSENKGKCRMWECLCDCGRSKIVSASNLRSGGSAACGNCRTPTSSAFKPVHGASVKKGPTYRSWQAMRRRVARPDERPYSLGLHKLHHPTLFSSVNPQTPIGSRFR